MIIEYVEDENNEKMESWTGYILALGMFLVAMIQTICLQHNFQVTYTVGMRIRTAIIGAIYRKVRDSVMSSWELFLYTPELEKRCGYQGYIFKHFCLLPFFYKKIEFL